jgi:hypothetical protein
MRLQGIPKAYLRTKVDTRNIARRTTARIQSLPDTRLATRTLSTLATIIGTRFDSGVLTLRG